MTAIWKITLGLGIVCGLVLLAAHAHQSRINFERDCYAKHGLMVAPYNCQFNKGEL